MQLGYSQTHRARYRKELTLTWLKEPDVLVPIALVGLILVGSLVAACRFDRFKWILKILGNEASGELSRSHRAPAATSTSTTQPTPANLAPSGSTNQVGDITITGSSDVQFGMGDNITQIAGSKPGPGQASHDEPTSPA